MGINNLRKEWGGSLTSFCYENGLVMLDTLCKHHLRRLSDWTSQYERVKKQITDYVQLTGPIKKAMTAKLQIREILYQVLTVDQITNY